MKKPFASLFFLPLFLLSAQLPAQTETLGYEIYANKGKIGNWELSRNEIGRRTLLSAKKTVIFKLVQKIKTETFYELDYLDGKLQRAEIKVFSNGDLRRTTTIRAEGAGTVFAVEGKPEQYLDKAVEISNLSIFFASPEGISDIFYLQKGIFLPVTSLGADGYEVALGKGEYNRYYYQDGRLVRAVLEDGLLRTTVKLVKTRGLRPDPLAGKE